MLFHSESLLEHQKDSGQGHPESLFSGKPSWRGSPILLHPLVTGDAMHAQCEVLDSSALRISTFTNKVRHSRITHNPHSFIAFVHLPCVLGLKGLQGIPTPWTGDRYSWVSIPASACAVCTQCARSARTWPFSHFL